jgi:septum formation topological specificity factor MinE
MSLLHVSMGIFLKKASARAESRIEVMYAKQKHVNLNGQNLQLMENGILKEVNKWVNYKSLTALV